MILTSYTPQYKSAVDDYLEEFLQVGSSPQGLSVRDGYDREVLGNVQDATFLYVREEDNRLVGMINIRYGLNAYLYREGGHVGYSVRPSEQGKGYGKQLLQEALAFCTFIGLEQVLVVCEEKNEVSAGVIRACGGVMEDEIVSEVTGVRLQRYWIHNVK